MEQYNKILHNLNAKITKNYSGNADTEYNGQKSFFDKKCVKFSKKTKEI